MKVLSTIGLALALTVAAGTAHAERTVKIGYYNYSDVIFTTHVVKYILEERMGRDVELTKADTGAIYQAVAAGDLDFFTESWLPETHSDYYSNVVGDVWNVGSLYTGAKLGWVVPDSIPEDRISSIEDLKSEEIRDRLDGKIIGIGPGAGLTRLSKKAMDEYGLKDFGYELQISSGPGMTAALKRAVQNGNWIVVTGWSPHWKFARWDLRYIDDPKGVLGGDEHIDTLVRDGLFRDDPEVFNLLTRIMMPLDHVEGGMYEGEESSYPEAAKKYVENHPGLVQYWVTGEFPEQ